MKLNSKITTVALLLLFASCIKSDYDTENCPGIYTITPLVPVELQQGSNNHLLETNTTVLYPGGTWNKTEVGADKSLDLLKGHYLAVSLKGEDDRVTLNGTTISVDADPQGAAVDPSDFVGGYMDFTVEGGLEDWDIINHDLPTLIQTRPLVLKVKMEGYNSALVESMTATVDGVTLSRDLLHAFIEGGAIDRYPALTSGYVDYELDEIDADGFYTGMRRLLGIDGRDRQTQELVLTIHYEGGVQKQFLFDITSDMDGFHTEEVTTPWVIRIVLRAGADFEATIEDWIAGPEEWLDAKPVG